MLCQLFLNLCDQLRFDAGHTFQGVDDRAGWQRSKIVFANRHVLMPRHLGTDGMELCPSFASLAARCS